MNRMINQLNRKGAATQITADGFSIVGFTGEEAAFLQKHKPQNVLIVYGSLAPGESNHEVVAHMRGKWKPATIQGTVEKIGWGAAMGYSGFTPAVAGEGEKIKAFVLFSDELSANWPMLDEFEGAEYKRILTVYELNNADVGVGYVYALAGSEENL